MAAPATSSGVPVRPRGTAASTILRMVSSAMTVMSLSKKPGAMAFTVMLSAANFLASDFVSQWIAHFEA